MEALAARAQHADDEESLAGCVALVTRCGVMSSPRGGGGVCGQWVLRHDDVLHRRPRLPYAAAFLGSTQFHPTKGSVAYPDFAQRFANLWGAAR
jgi:hypothetical protein